ncbi:MAG: hypothetical protein GXY71_00320 [Treponema sp.]|jgi:hypothetical protein|nr:hypothetical protein [Treponema sp.]
MWKVLALCLSLWACSPKASELLLPLGDIRPPSVVDAGQTDAHSFTILFDEDVLPVLGSFSFHPAEISATPSAEGPLLKVGLNPEAEPGRECSLLGEVKDAAGNSTRFLFGFVGFNPIPAKLRLNEVQPCKNTAASNFHRDYIELLVEEAGNLGGIQLQWSSTVKVVSYSFPPCFVRVGELIVLHCLPEGVPEEKDECGDDRGLSGGVDAHPGGRDFWASGGGIPDATGVIVLRSRASDPVEDGVFFAEKGKLGEVDSSKISMLLGEMASRGIWDCSEPPLWEEALLWKSSSSRPLHCLRKESKGKGSWYIGESGSQSPGSLEPGVLAAKGGRKAGKPGSP